MAWRWNPEAFAAGDHVTPHEVMSQFTTMAGEFNGLVDRDNIDSGFEPGATQMVSQACNKVSIIETTATTTVTLTAGTTTGWFDLSTYALTVTTLDGVVEVIFSHTFQADPASTGISGEWRIAFSLTMDSDVVIESPGDSLNTANHRAVYLSAVIPVAAGSHRFGVMASLYRGRGTAAGTFDINFNHGQLLVHEARR